MLDDPPKAEGASSQIRRQHPNSLANLANGVRFKPGQSGNPGGRPKKVREVADKALAMAEDALDELWDIAKDKQNPPAVRLAAIKEIHDRGIGRAPQSIDITQETKHSLSEEFEYFVRRLNDRNDREMQELQDRVAAEDDYLEIDFSEVET